MRIIAIEEHFLADGFREVMKKRGVPSLAGGLQEVFVAHWQAKLVGLGAARLKDMDASGIDLQVLSHTPFDISSLSMSEEISLARSANDQLAEICTAYPARFAGFAALPLMDPAAAADELERAVRLLGFKGALIHGTINGRFLDDPSFLPLLERAAALEVPLYLHPAEPPVAVREAYFSGFAPEVNFALATAGWGWHSEVGLHALRLILAGVFDRLPTLQVIIGHMGEMLPFMLARSTMILTPVARHLQRTVAEYFLHHFFITTSGFFTDPPLLLVLQVLGADRILFAVDYPYSSNDQGHAFLERASISPADKEKISHLNAERLLKLAQREHSSR
jgi:uncharacterized protein